MCPARAPQRINRWRYCIPSDRGIGTISAFCQSFSSSQTRYNSSRLHSIPKLAPNQRACHPAARHFTESLPHQACALQCQLDPCIAEIDAMFLAQLLVEMPHVEIEVLLPIQL